MRTQTQENMGKFQLEERNEGQQFILRNLRRNTLEGPERSVPEDVAPGAANEGNGSTVAPPPLETAVHAPQSSTSLVGTMSGAAEVISSEERNLLQWDMGTVETRQVGMV